MDKNGMMMVGLPNETYELMLAVAKHKQISVNKAFSQALLEYARKNLSFEEIEKIMDIQRG